MGKMHVIGAFAAAALSAASAIAAEQKVGKFTWYYEAYDGEAEIVNLEDAGPAVSPEPPSGTLTIPPALGGCPVTVIGTEAFENFSSMTGVNIPTTVTGIGSYAFCGCTALKAVTIPASVTDIDIYAFGSCAALESVTIPSGVTRIGSFAFDGCERLKSVTIPSSLGEIEEDTFFGCWSLSAVTIPGSVKAVGAEAFMFCVGMSSLTIKDGVRKIGERAFNSCESLVSVTIPDSVTTIGDGAFEWCESLRSVSLPAHFKGKLDVMAVFSGCADNLVITYRGAAQTYKVTFGKNGGEGGDNYVTATYGKPMPTPRKAPTKPGYVFAGYWDTTKAGGKQYYDKDMKSVRNWDKTSPATLWAKWETAVKVKVTFSKNGGAGGDNYVTATYGAAMPTPRKAPTRSGWTFAGYWDSVAMDANGTPKGKQYYDAKMKSVRSWDKTSPATLWAKWTVRVKLGKNGGTGGDDYVTATYNQPFPKRAMPTKSGYKFGGYYVSSSKKTGQCYNKDGTGTSTMKWSTGGTPTIWALWTK